MPRIRQIGEKRDRSPLDSRIDEDMKRLERGIGRYFCGDDRCKTRAHYGFLREKGLSCVKHVYAHPHTDEPMTHVTNRCRFTEHGEFTCMNSAHYGPKGKGSAVSCGVHKDEMAKHHGGGLCDKTKKECQTETCYGIGRYSLGSDATNPKKLHWCSTCVPHLGDLIDPTYVNIGQANNCKVTGDCEGRARYCLRTDHTEKCVACPACAKKHPGTYRYVLAPSVTCVTCLDIFKTDPTHIKKQKLYGFADPETNENFVGIPLYCGDCRLPGTIDLVHPQCSTPHCAHGAKKRGGYCSGCLTNTIRKKKEALVHETLKTLSDRWINDKMMDDTGFGKSRPDFRLVLNDRMIIVECDEYAHASYPAPCENKRTLDIHGAAHGVPLIIIPFNPDAKTASGVVIGTGYPGIKKRHQKLLEIVREAFQVPVTQGMVHIWYMYYGVHIPFLDTHRPAEANLQLQEDPTGSKVLRRFQIDVDRGVVDEYGLFHPFVREYETTTKIIL